MNKATCLVGAGIILGGMAGPVEARLVRYQIDGKVYSYSTRNRQQVESAHHRIAAAKAAYAAYAARIRADAELASNPVVNILGSPAQKEAAAAQARFEQVSSEEPAAPAESPVTAPGERPISQKLARAKSLRPLIKTRPNRAIARERTQFASIAGPDGPRPTHEPSSEVPRVPEVTINPVPNRTSLQGEPKPTLKSVTFDLSSGIKSVQMTDGTVHEEPLDSSMVTTLRSLEPAAESLNSFLEVVRTHAPLDLTVTPSDRPE